MILTKEAQIRLVQAYKTGDPCIKIVEFISLLMISKCKFYAQIPVLNITFDKFIRDVSCDYLKSFEYMPNAWYRIFKKEFKTLTKYGLN